MQFLSGVLLFYSCFTLIKSSALANNNTNTIIKKVNLTNIETVEYHNKLIGNHEVHTISHLNKSQAFILEIKDVDGDIIVTSRHVFRVSEVKFLGINKKGEIKLTNHEPNLFMDVPIINDEIYFHKILTDAYEVE